MKVIVEGNKDSTITVKIRIPKDIGIAYMHAVEFEINDADALKIWDELKRSNQAKFESK